MDATEAKTQRQTAKIVAPKFEPLETALDLPYVTISEDELLGRAIPVTSFHDPETGWHLWIKGNDGKWLPMAATNVAGIYFAAQPEHPDDFYSHFLNFAFRRASYEKVIHWSQCILADLQNLGTSLAKLRILCLNQPPDSHFARMAATELEYIFMVCRSLLDLQQEVISELWPLISFTDGTAKKSQLPTSFADMVLRAKSPMTAEEISERHKLPMAMAAEYANSGSFLQWFREFRDNVAHRGQSIDLVFAMEDGFGVSTEVLPFSKMPIWSEVNLKPNAIGSLHSAACYVIGMTTSTLNRMADLLVQTIRFPAPLAAGYVLYARGHFIDELSRLEEGINGRPWYSHTAPEASAIPKPDQGSGTQVAVAPCE